MTALTAAVVLILFFSTLVRATLGFGDALLAMPVLALLVGIRTAAPLVAMAAPVIAALILVRNWRLADARAAARLILATLLGIPVGLFFLKNVNEDAVNLVLAGVLLLYGLIRILGLRAWRLKNEKFALIFGFAAGLLGGAYNTNGPPVVVYGTLRGWDPARFRATLQGYFLPTGGAILVGHGLAGLWTGRVITLFLWSLPAIVAAVIFGSKLHRAVPAARFERWVYFALLALGAGLLIKSL